MALVASCAVEDFKILEDFKIEVGDVVYDTYLKGFSKCKAKVSIAFSSLDLQDIVADAKEEGEEGESEAEDEAKTPEKAFVAKVEKFEVVTTTRTVAIRDSKKPEAAIVKVAIEENKLSIAVEVLKKVGIKEDTAGSTSMQEDIAQVATEIKAIIIAVMEVIKADSSTPPTTNN